MNQFEANHSNQYPLSTIASSQTNGGTSSDLQFPSSALTATNTNTNTNNAFLPSASGFNFNPSSSRLQNENDLQFNGSMINNCRSTPSSSVVAPSSWFKDQM